MIQGVIIEGLSTAGKTSVFAAIKKIHSQISNAQSTVIAISEHYSQVLHSHHGVLRSMSKDEHIDLLNRHVEYLEHQNDWINSLGHTKSTKGIFFILERFHLNHRGAFEDYSGIEKLEQRLLKLNAHCVLLTLSPTAVESRFVESRGEAWKEYIMKNLSNTTEACLKFQEDQEKLRFSARQSIIPTFEINTDSADWESYAHQILKDIDN